MKKVLLFVLVILFSTVSVISQHALAEDAAGESFVFRNGITWGMTRDQVTALEDGEYTESGLSGLDVLAYANKQAEQLDAQLGYVFYNDSLVMTLYYFVITPEQSDALRAAYVTEYGGKEAGQEAYIQIAAKMNVDPESLRVLDESYFCKWNAPGNTMILALWPDQEYLEQFMQQDNLFPLEILYVSPEFAALPD